MPYRFTEKHTPFFMTISTQGWIDLFTRKELADIIIKNLRFCVEYKKLNVNYYCLMPSHLHLICWSDEHPPHEIINNFKSFTAKKIVEFIESQSGESRAYWLKFLLDYYGVMKNGGGKSVWQRSNYPIELFSDKVFEQKVDYIHHNPVKAGFVLEAEHYYYSSANKWNPLADVLSD